MSTSPWRQYWPEYRVKFVDETARCLADHQNAANGGWKGLTKQQQNNLTDYTAAVFLAQARAMDNLVKQGSAL